MELYGNFDLCHGQTSKAKEFRQMVVVLMRLLCLLCDTERKGVPHMVFVSDSLQLLIFILSIHHPDDVANSPLKWSFDIGNSLWVYSEMGNSCP